MSDDDDPWRCQNCGRTYVVQSLARECEKKHEEAIHEESD